jgi:hypothetical protein
VVNSRLRRISAEQRETPPGSASQAGPREAADEDRLFMGGLRLANAWAPHRFPVIRHCRGFLLARLLFSKRTASSALTAAVLAESPPANSVSEREANDQGDSDFQHSDKCAEPATRPPEPTNTAQGQGLGNPRCVFIKETRPVRQGSWPTLKPASVLGAHNRSGSRSPCFANSILSLASGMVAG